MRLNENLIYSEQGGYVLIKNSQTGMVVRIPTEAAVLLRLLESAGFDTTKAACEFTRNTGKEVMASSIDRFLRQAVELNLVIPDQENVPQGYSDWHSGRLLTRTIMNPEQVFGFLFRWLSWIRYVMLSLAIFATVGAALLAAKIFIQYRPALNGRILFGLLFFFVVSLIHEIGHWLICKFFGGSVTGLGVGFMHWVIPYFWSELSDIWFFKSRVARILAALGGSSFW